MELKEKTCFSNNAPSLNMGTVSFPNKVNATVQREDREELADYAASMDVDVDLREIYFLIMHFLSAGPCQRTFRQMWDELLEHELLPRRYHAWYSRSGTVSGNENDDGNSLPLNYSNLIGRYSHVEKDHLAKLLKRLMLMTCPPLQGTPGRTVPSAVDVPTLLGSGTFSLLSCERNKVIKQVRKIPSYLRWPHMQADQVRGLSLREIGGGFAKHHRAPSIRVACYAIAKPSSMVPKMQNMKKLRGHRDAVYCAIFDRSGRYVITGSDDRLVKIWSMETALCLASCRGHEGDITDLSVSSNNAVVASASNDFTIRVWRLPDGYPVSVLRGHTGAVTAIVFSPTPRAQTQYHLLSSSDDGTCRVWDARYSQMRPRVYLPKPSDARTGPSSGSASALSSTALQAHQILCCAFNANGTIFVTGSSDTFARVWSCKPNTDDPDQVCHEIDILAGHENDVNYVQFSGCAVASRSFPSESTTEDNIPKLKTSWSNHNNIVTCSRDGSAIIWVPRSRRSHVKVGRWVKAYHLKVPPPPMPPRPPRGGPRQRYLPTRGVNMIVWSLDNRFVLAAIMDNRICVWNANDGSLVHSLAGHSASTYVLDVHPFNPRIAMSASYDGKTILWDIWEGTPIRVYEIGGRFKLVDGKFSQDGTSIVLSDDVGQIYLLNTGERESQKDAKYDQETQLAPYVRNIQDPLCDSSMLPYPEPYQSTYQPTINFEIKDEILCSFDKLARAATKDKMKHGTRVIFGVFRKSIFIVGDTRLVRDDPINLGEIIICNDVSSKILITSRFVGAYVGSELLWDEARTLLKKHYDDQKSNLKELGKIIYESLKKIPLGKDNQGIELLIAHHQDGGVKSLFIVVNPPRDPHVPRDTDDRQNGYNVVDDFSRGSFFSMGAGYTRIENYIRESSKKTEDEILRMLKCGLVLSSLEFECIGGTIEVVRLGPGPNVNNPRVERVKILEQYLIMLKLNFAELDNEDKVILTFHRGNQKQLASWEIKKGLRGKSNKDCVFMGSLRDNKGATYFVNRLSFGTIELAREAVAKIIEVDPQSRFMDMKCFKIRTVCVFFSFANPQLATLLIDNFKF